VSTYRYYSFTVAFVVVAFVSLWCVAVACLISKYKSIIVSLLLYSLAAGSLLNLYLSGWHVLKYQLPDQLRFACGRISYAEAFAEADVFEPTYAKAREVAGVKARIWCPHFTDAAGAVPGRCLETEPSFGFPDWHLMVFAEPQVAKSALQRHGLNYFLIDLSKPVFGALAFSPLLSPDNLDASFEVAFHEGTTYLLTWRHTDAALGELPKFWAVRLAESPYKALYERVQSYYQKHGGRAYPVYDDPRLPPVPGWQ
jgi:hypothetical protein